MRTAALLVPALVSVLAACGDDGGSGVRIDARIIGDDAPPPDARPCLAPQLGALTPMDEYAERDADTNPEYIYYDAAINADPQYDYISLELYKGYGAFTDGEIEPQTIQLTGDEAAFESCGACVLIHADYDEDQETALGGTYLAVGGALDITGVSPNLRGTLINAQFAQITIDDEGVSTPTGACATEVASFAFDFPVTTVTE